MDTRYNGKKTKKRWQAGDHDVRNQGCLSYNALQHKNPFLDCARSSHRRKAKEQVVEVF